MAPETANAAKGVAAPVTHGAALEAGMTGPAALGVGLRPVHMGDAIRDGRRYPFAREIAHGATYDGFPVAGPHLLIEGVVLVGPVDVFTARPVVLRGVSLVTDNAAPWGLLTRPSAGPLLFLWSEVGARTTTGAPDDASRRLAVGLHLASDGAVIYRSHVTRAADGIQVHGVGTRIIETVIDGLVHWHGDHNDGLQMIGRAGDLVVMRSRIENPNPLVACLNLNGDRVRVEASYLAGGGYSLYGGARRNGQGPGATREVVVRDTVFGRRYFPQGGHFGPVTYWDGTPGTGNVWQDNRFDDGEPIRDPSAFRPRPR
jgi:hypothetical protein